MKKASLIMHKPICTSTLRKMHWANIDVSDTVRKVYLSCFLGARRENRPQMGNLSKLFSKSTEN